MKYPTYTMLQGAQSVENLTPTQTLDLMLSCIDFIYDGEQNYKASEQTSEELHSFIDQLTQAHFLKIQEFFETMPQLEHTVSYTCTNKIRTGDATSEKCGHKARVVISSLQNFFV